MSTRTALTPGEFIERYGRYFNRKRVEAIQGLGFLFVEGAGEGPYFDDSEGNRFLDMWCMGGTFSLGHRNPAVVAAAEEAMKEEDFGSLFFFSAAKGELAQKLAECTPGRLETTHPVVTGAEAIDLSVKLARGCTKRSEILYADHAYHGCTGFALSMMAKGDMRDYAEPLVPDFHEIRYGDAADLAAGRATLDNLALFPLTLIVLFAALIFVLRRQGIRPETSEDAALAKAAEMPQL